MESVDNTCALIGLQESRERGLLSGLHYYVQLQQSLAAGEILKYQPLEYRPNRPGPECI